LRHRLETLCRRTTVPRLTPHGLRHSAATLLLEAGVHPKIVQELLGHSSITMTLDLYSHVSEGLQRTAAERLDAILGDTTSTTTTRQHSAQ
jgi:integrase